jgi:hypothetical protein
VVDRGQTVLGTANCDDVSESGRCMLDKELGTMIPLISSNNVGGPVSATFSASVCDTNLSLNTRQLSASSDSDSHSMNLHV